MKVGILTYHRAHNHGALLQAFALKEVLKSYDHNTEIVDYWPDYHDNAFQLIPFFKYLSFLNKIKSIIKFLVSFRINVKRKITYSQFIKHYLLKQGAATYNNIEKLKLADFDLTIYGSDQIWRKQSFPSFKGFDEAYFGEYISSKKKITYAASMGIIDIKEKDILFLRNKLTNFSVLSVREDDLKDLLNKQLNIKTNLVLDPVFLLSKKKWENYLPKKRIINKKYIFFYHLLRSEEAELFVKRIKQQTGYEVIEIKGRAIPFSIGKRYSQQAASPFDFISLIRDAEYVISTSFHGVAFSIIFNKQFYALGLSKNSSRVSTLLNKLKINDRIISIDTPEDNQKHIDYSHVIPILKEQTEKSLSFLHSAINS